MCLEVKLTCEIKREILKLRENMTHDDTGKTAMETVRNSNSNSLICTTHEILFKHILYSSNY